MFESEGLVASWVGSAVYRRAKDSPDLTPIRTFFQLIAYILGVKRLNIGHDPEVIGQVASVVMTS
jgi:hypothetical protein